MSLIVEDGSNVAGADSYASLDSAYTYHENYSNTAWLNADDEAQEVALRKATVYIDSKYQFKGERVAATQSLAWPRSGVVLYGASMDSAYIPPKLVAATCELALRALTGELVEDVASQYVESVTVGPISRTLSAPQFSGQKRFYVADSLLRDLVRGGEYNIAMVRA